MRVLLEFTTLNYRTMHSFAKRLKELFPDSQFAGFVGIAAGGEASFNYLKEQTEIKYEFLQLHHEIIKESLNDPIDHELLRKFEQSTPEKSLWRLIAMDRQWGSSFLHGAVVNKNFITTNNSHENILRVFSGALKRYRSFFERFQPHLFIPAMCIGSISVHIFESICRDRKLPYIVPTTMRINNIFAFTNDHLLHSPVIDQAYKDIYARRIAVDLTEAEKLYESLMTDLTNSQFFDRNLPCHNVVYLKTLGQKIVFFLGAVKSIGNVVWRWLKNTPFNASDDVRRQPFKLSILWDNIKRVLKHKYQNYCLLSPKFGKILEPGQKYLYYPLHTSPEYSTSFQGTMWMNQEFLIESLAKSIPSDWIIYVKEHPGTIPDRVRPADFFKNLEKFPNVVMAPVGTSSHEIISNAQMVAVVTGTSGWEAVQRGIPLITFGDNFYDVTGLARRCQNIESLCKDINDEIHSARAITAEERKRRIVCLLAAVLKEGFTITHPNQFCHEPGTVEQYELSGRELADALLKYMENLESIDRGEKRFQNVG